MQQEYGVWAVWVSRQNTHWNSCDVLLKTIASKVLKQGIIYMYQFYVKRRFTCL